MEIVVVLGNRWYDKNPRVSFAVGCVEEADKDLRKKFAKLIIKHARELKVVVKRPNPKLFFRRWYDKDPDLSLAMEYFKTCNEEQRLVIAEHIITYVKTVAVRQT